MTTESAFVSDTAILRKTRLSVSAFQMPSATQLGVHDTMQITLTSTTESSSVVAVAANSHPVLLGLTRYLKASRFRAMAVMASPLELISSIIEMHPKIVIIEISSQSMEGFEAIAAIHRLNPVIKILVLADYTMPSLVKMVFRSGAHGYLLSMPTQAEILHTLDALCNEENVLDKQLEYLRPNLDGVINTQCILI